jgi:hypothetical protein
MEELQEWLVPFYLAIKLNSFHLFSIAKNRIYIPYEEDQWFLLQLCSYYLHVLTFLEQVVEKPRKLQNFEKPTKQSTQELMYSL